MSNTIIKKRAQILTLILVLSVFVTFATTKIIGRKVDRAYLQYPSIFLNIPRGALTEDTEISAEMVMEDGRVCFISGPYGIVYQWFLDYQKLFPGKVTGEQHRIRFREESEKRTHPPDEWLERRLVIRELRDSKRI